MLTCFHYFPSSKGQLDYSFSSQQGSEHHSHPGWLHGFQGPSLCSEKEIGGSSCRDCCWGESERNTHVFNGAWTQDLLCASPVLYHWATSPILAVSEMGFHHAAQAGFKLLIILLQPPKSWDVRCVPPCPAGSSPWDSPPSLPPPLPPFSFPQVRSIVSLHCSCKTFNSLRDWGTEKNMIIA